MCSAVVARAVFCGMDGTAIEVSDLRKDYDGRPVLRGVSFSVAEGEVFGLLGPNGAGKTTAVETLEGLRRPDSGTVRVLGLDPERDGPGAAGSGSACSCSRGAQLPEKMRVGEALELYAGFYRNPRPVAGAAGTDWELEAKRNAGVQDALRWPAAAAVPGAGPGRQEPPSWCSSTRSPPGVDPAARRQTWELVRRVRGRGGVGRWCWSATWDGRGRGALRPRCRDERRGRGGVGRAVGAGRVRRAGGDAVLVLVRLCVGGARAGAGRGRGAVRRARRLCERGAPGRSCWSRRGFARRDVCAGTTSR